ncbi:MAG: HisA/HisF-related TIM barrel protein [Gammaproteobacteria bacterium]
MRCVAVVDLKAGQVVHAVRGDRRHYAPVRSRLCTSAAPQAVVAALRERLRVTAFYVADLDAIQQCGSSRALIAELIAAHADCEWWVDADFGAAARLEAYLSASNVKPVIGSESLREAEDLAQVLAALPRPHDAILSLDHRGGHGMGPPALWQAPATWPAKVIAMNLDRVGAAAGPDLGLIARLRGLATAVVAAGGVRDAQDLALLEDAGVSDVLLATALHDGRIGPTELAPYLA